MSSAGCWLTKTFGTALVDLPGRFALTSFQLSSAGSFLKLSGSVPAAVHGPLHVARFQPRVVVAQVVRVGRNMLKQIPVRVDRELQVVVLDRAPDRFAIEVHDHRRRLAEEDGGRIGLDAFDVLRHDRALVDIGQDAIERNHAFVVWNRLVNLCDDLAHLLLRQRLKVRFGDLHFLKADQPIVEGDLRVRLDLDRAERRLVATLAAIGHGAERLHVRLLLPARNLRLIDEDASLARQAVHPRPATVDWLRCGRRYRRERGLRSGLGRRLRRRRDRFRRRLRLARRGHQVCRRLHQHAQRRDNRRNAVCTGLMVHRVCILLRKYEPYGCARVD